jgi:hypothetical protein
VGGLRNIWLSAKVFRTLTRGGGEEVPADSPQGRAHLKALEVIALNTARWIDSLAALGIAPPAVPRLMAEVIREQDMLQIADPAELSEAED